MDMGNTKIPQTTKYQRSSSSPDQKIVHQRPSNNAVSASTHTPQNSQHIHNMINNNNNNCENDENPNYEGEGENENYENEPQEPQEQAQPHHQKEDYSDIGGAHSRIINTYLQNNQSQLNNSSNYYKKNETLDVDFLKKKIHKINKLNMNLRFEVAKLNEKLENSEKLIHDQAKTIKILEKQKDNDSEYLLKLENIICMEKRSNSVKLMNKSSNSNNISSNSINLNTTHFNNKSNMNNKSHQSHQTGKTNLNNNNTKNKKITMQPDEIRFLQLDNNFTIDLNEKNDLSQLLQMMYQENQRLKFFQNNIIQLSKNYDEINENMVVWMKDVNLLVEGLPKNYDEVNFQSIIGKTN